MSKEINATAAAEAKSLIARASELAANGKQANEESKARKEGAGIVKRSNSYFIDPTSIARKEGFNPRFDFGEIEQLAASIKANGIINPIRVQRATGRDDGKAFELIDGDRRLTAIEALLKKGHEFPEGIPAIIVDKSQDEITSLVQMFVANDGKQFNPLEEAAAYKKMRDAGMTVKQICSAVGRASMHVTEILALVDADASVHEAVRSGAIGKTQAKEIAKHAKGDAEKQKELVKQASEAKDKTKRAELKKSIDDSRRAKAAKKGKQLKMRALTDAELSTLGAKLAEGMVKIMKEAGQPLDADLRAWVAKDEKLALAARFGALEALKAAAGMDLSLEF